MGIFNFNKNKDSSQNTIPLDPMPSIDELTIADSSVSPLISNATSNYVLSGGVQYNDREQEKLMKGNASKGEQKTAKKVDDGILLMDIAQSHHYTVSIEDMEMSRLVLPNGTYTTKGFLPVKTMSLKYTSYENMSIPVAIFGDFPLLNKKRVSTIDLSCYDYDNNKLEWELRVWESKCFPQGRFVAYMNDIARKFTYQGYNVKGKRTLLYEVYVIPAGNLTVSRDYSANDAKMVNFSLVVVGDGQTCAVGKAKEPEAKKVQQTQPTTAQEGKKDFLLSGYEQNTVFDQFTA